MAPFGPPPYTQEQIAAMTSLEERKRAGAELQAYVNAFKKYVEERNGGQRNSRPLAPAYAGAGNTGAGRGGYYGPGQYSYNNRGNNTSYGTRGSYNYRGGRGGQAARYHPYSRPPTFQAPARNPTTVGGLDENTGPKEEEDIKGASKEPLTSNTPSWRDEIKPKGLCSRFTSTGVCSGKCSYIHDPNKLAACKRWLFKGDCAMGPMCSLSHDISPHNAPTCIHFQGGLCNNEKCRFAHIRINPAARNCEAFGILGYCEKGDTCAELHANECPTFANTGECRFGDTCRYGHVRRAARMRTTTRLSSPVPSPSAVTPVTSDSPEENVGTGNGSLNTSEESLESILVEQEPKQFTQQADYISLEEQ